ncbi:MAG: glycosyltransferase family 2 protein [Verrucomicrobia bacterium]|jgi:polyisoprenyl-phosphate glycosyltransferase|nr:glycosyltransferase family 2 protein [Verrucomicrobiota bacterium]MBT7065408.1 glycosyltransferase family 2 protein [Verrucomicrobiota bacterium]MBT7700336.1 glycosyltransferase family 2 protein [Verrucomicrobiota bacterium]
MNAEAKTVSVVVPYLNEEEALPVLYERTCKAFEALPEELEFLFVDDGSRDGSFEWVCKAAENDARVKYIKLSRNFGHQMAITAGMKHATGDAVVTIDADLQDPPETIPDMITKWKEGFEVVHAIRTSRKGEKGLKKLFAFAFYRIFKKITEVEMVSDSGDFRLLDRKAAEAMSGLREHHRYMRGLAAWIGFKQGSVLYTRDPRYAGEVKYTFKKSFVLALNAIASFSGTPLRMIFYLGGWICAGSMVGAVASWIYHMNTGQPRHIGTVTLAFATLFITGIQMFCIGIIGQYLRRVFDEIKDRPLYLVQSQNF